MLAVAAAVLVLPLAADAQTTDARWNTWLGCWELVLDRARESATAPGQVGRPSQTPIPNNNRPQVCVERAGAGVTFSTRVGTETPIAQTVVADGAEHSIVDSDCRGTQRAEWSSTGRQLFSAATLTCAGDSSTRTVSGFAILGPNETWTDIQAVEIGGRESVRVRRYRRVTTSAQAVRPRGAGAPLTLDDVKEAASKVSARALEAALVETGSIFELSGRDLVSLQDAGVPSSVTDLMVALSYPDRFVVERTAPDDRAPMISMIDDPFMLGWAFGYPMWGDGFGFYSPFYSPYSSYFYSPFSYSYLRYYNPQYFGGGSAILVPGGGPGGGGSLPTRPSGAGRVVDGQGYTRVRPRDAESASASQSGSVRAPASVDSSSRGGGTVSSQGFSSGGSSSSSSGGSSSGSSWGSSDGGGRTAQPR
jgi:hypothetical protein